MLEGQYRRLSCGGCCGALSALIVKKSGRGGARPGAGRPRKNLGPPERSATKQCPDCGSLVAVKGNRKYCDGCAARRRALKSYTGCDHLKPLLANGRQRKFCYDCLPKPAKVREGWRTRYAKRCARQGCGREFAAKSEAAAYCSDKCRNAASNKAGCERRRDRSARTCATCSTRFAPGYGDKRRRYCSEVCRTKRANIRSGGNTHVRRARKYGCEIERVDRQAVFERDDWVCRLCGDPVDREAKWPDPGSATLDHITPMSKGGAHKASNVQCAHLGCNLSKGAGDGAERRPAQALPALTPKG